MGLAKKFSKFIKVVLTNNGSSTVKIFLLFSIISINAFAQETSGAQVSSNGIFSLTKESNISSFPSGGGTVTYTYTIQNLTSNKIFFVRAGDNKCSPVKATTPLQSEQGSGETVFFIPANANATWTCTSDLSETTTNVADFTFASGHRRTGFFFTNFEWINEGDASASVTVTRDLPPGALNCNTLWYSSDERGIRNGEVGTLNTTTGLPTQIFDIDNQISGTLLEGSPAMAVNPADPTKIYYVPRNEAGNTFGGMYVYDTNTSISTEVSNAANNPLSIVRLSVDPNGLVWTVIGNGTAYSFDPATGVWTNRGVVILPTGYNWTTLGSGDLTFDGHGTMYLVASDTSNGILFTVIQSELLDGSPQSVLVGDLGTERYNGIAFTEDGNLWGSSYNGTLGISTLYKIDIATGNAAFPLVIPGLAVTDLGSCALPKAVLNGSKTSTPSGTLNPGDELTYTIEICNNGSLASTGTIFKDVIPAGTTYVANSTTQNGTAVADIGGNMPYISGKEIFSDGENQGSIGIGECVTIELKITVDGDFAGTEICNSAFVDYTYNDGEFATDDPFQPGGSDPTCNTVINPLITINKTAPLTDITSPQDITYRYEVTNVGSDVLTGITVTDDMCSTVTYISGDTNGDTKLQEGEIWIYECTSNIDAETTNIATANATGELSALSTTATDTWTISIPANVTSLAVDKTSSPTGDVEEGDTITYTINIENTGDIDAINTTLEDVLPPGVTYVNGTAQKTYWETNGSIVTTTGTVTKNLPQLDFNNGNTSRTIAFTTADGIPAGATLTNLAFTINGRSNEGGFFQSDAQRDDIELNLSYPGGEINVDRGSIDIDDNEFGPASDGTWNTVNRDFAVTGDAIGDYIFTFYDDGNQSANPENRVFNTSSITISWTNTVNTQTRDQTTNAANAPENMVLASDAITLQPGETMTVTLQGLVGSTASGDLINTATANADTAFAPISDTAINTFLDPCTRDASTDGTPTASDSDGDGINDICDLDDDNDGILDTGEVTCSDEELVSTPAFDQNGGFVAQTGSYNTGGFSSSTDNTANYSFSDIRRVYTSGTGELRGVFYTDSQRDSRTLANNGSITVNDSDLNITSLPSQLVTNSKYEIIDLDLANGAFEISLLDSSGSLITGIENLSYETTGVDGTLSVVESSPGAFEFTLTGNTVGNNISLVLNSVNEPFHGVTFTLTSNPTFSGEVLLFRMNRTLCTDTDEDGLIDSLDTDSDNDGCPDAVEANGSFIVSQLTTLTGGSNSADSSLLNFGTTVNNTEGSANYGVPIADANGLDISTDTPQDTTPAGLDKDDTSACVTDVDLSLTKTVNKAIVKVGDTIVYTLTVKNDGPSDATGVQVTDVLPSGVTYNSTGTGTVIPSGTTYNDALTPNIWNIGNVAVNQTIILQLEVTVNGAGTITNTSEITHGDQPDTDSVPNNSK